MTLPIDVSKIHDSKNLPHPNPPPQAEEGTVFTPSLARVACGGGLGWGQEIVANYGNVNKPLKIGSSITRLFVLY